MGAKSRFFVDGRIGYIAIVGKYTFSIAASSFNEMVVNDALTSTTATVWDLTSAEVEFKPGEAAQLALLVQRSLPLTRNPRRVAVVGNHSSVQGVFEVFKSMILRDTLVFRFFQQMSAAQQWLTLGPGNNRTSGPLVEGHRLDVVG